ncbi:MAG: hypothetical protein IKY73_07590 [Bacteroidaceae bacterium]|nr:hypothetical protein [Bacteroidaceae bacterium]
MEKLAKRKNASSKGYVLCVSTNLSKEWSLRSLGCIFAGSCFLNEASSSLMLFIAIILYLKILNYQEP